MCDPEGVQDVPGVRDGVLLAHLAADERWASIGRADGHHQGRRWGNRCIIYLLRMTPTAQQQKVARMKRAAEPGRYDMGSIYATWTWTNSTCPAVPLRILGPPVVRIKSRQKARLLPSNLAPGWCPLHCSKTIHASPSYWPFARPLQADG